MKKAIILLIAFSLFSCGGSESFKERKPIKVTDPLKNFKTAEIKTSMGDIIVTLHWDAAPNTCLNFAKLVKKSFYTNIIFHRVLSNFMIQTGDPTGTGRGGPGYKVNDEMDANALGLDKIKTKSSQMYGRDKAKLGVRLLKIKSRQEAMQRMDELKALHKKMDDWSVKKLYQKAGYTYTKGLKSLPPKRGSLAMANAGPDTNGSQFFINVIDTKWLTGKHTVFGTVTKGMEIVDAISKVKANKQGKPEKTVFIKEIILKYRNIL